MLVPYIDKFGRIAYHDSDNPGTDPINDGPSSKPIVNNPMASTPTDPTRTTPTTDPNATQHTGSEGGGFEGRDTGGTPAGGQPRESKDGTALGGLKEVGGYLAQATSLPGLAAGIVEGVTGFSIKDAFTDAMGLTDTVADRENAIQGADLSDRAGFGADQGDRTGGVASDGGSMEGSSGPGGDIGGEGHDGAFKQGGLVDQPGMVSGPGGPKDDKIEARLSDGEYVATAEAVDLFGKSFFDRINQAAKEWKTTGLMPRPEDLFQGFGEENTDMPMEDSMAQETPLEMGMAEGGMVTEGLDLNDGNYLGSKNLIPRTKSKTEGLNLKQENTSYDPSINESMRAFNREKRENQLNTDKKQSFAEAFRAARSSGQRIFEWNGKKYTSETKEEQMGRKTAKYATQEKPNPPSRADQGLYAEGGLVQRPKKISIEYH